VARPMPVEAPVIRMRAMADPSREFD
jgi:hypothetical protein